MLEPLAEGAIPDLIMVLDTVHKCCRWEVGRRGSTRLAGSRAGLPLKEPTGAKRRRDFSRAAREIAIVTLVFTGQRHAHGVMKVVGPDGVKPVSAGSDRAYEPGLVAGVFRDKHEVPAGIQRGMHALHKLLNQMHRAIVDNCVRRVEAQAIHVIFMRPIERVVNEEAAHRLTAGPIEIERIAPRGMVARGKVLGRKVPQVVARRTQVVVDDILDHRQALRMSRIDKALEPFSAAVSPRRSIEIDAVIAPVAFARKVSYRQDLDGGYP